MHIKYKIIAVHPNEHQIVVRYYSDKMTEKMQAVEMNGELVIRSRSDFALDLPIPAPKGAALHEFILRAAPFHFFEKHEKIANPKIDTSLKEIRSLIGREFVGEQPGSAPPVQTSAITVESV
jgi:hypothetical protein